MQGNTCNFIKKEILAQVSSCEFCKISKNTFFYRTLPSDCFYTTEIPLTTSFVLLTVEIQISWNNSPLSCYFFLHYQEFLSRTLAIHRAISKGRLPSLFLSTSSTFSWILRHLVVLLQLTNYLVIFNRIG